MKSYFGKENMIVKKISWGKNPWSFLTLTWKGACTKPSPLKFQETVANVEGSESPSQADSQMCQCCPHSTGL